jgi:hypothetical protein
MAVSLNDTTHFGCVVWQLLGRILSLHSDTLRRLRHCGIFCGDATYFPDVTASQSNTQQYEPCLFALSTTSSCRGKIRRTLCGPHSRSGCVRDEKNLFPLSGIANCDPSVVWSVVWSLYWLNCQGLSSCVINGTYIKTVDLQKWN